MAGQPGTGWKMRVRGRQDEEERGEENPIVQYPGRTKALCLPLRCQYSWHASGYMLTHDGRPHRCIVAMRPDRPLARHLPQESLK